ncbi:hypothetical protein ACFOY2_45525 [Nonomuraea purpurea]|uniref:Uncharacterized protein n=1 Tax=Nonomuraea purpurea TaxID=1849276 RepID=A0ABV8GKS5_9ACTN
MEVESSICLSDLVPALRWSRPQQVAEALGDPRLPAGWWSSLALSKALGTAGLDWICERLARLASSRWDHLPLADLLPALTVHHIDPTLPGWPDATRTAITGLGGWQRLRRLSPSDLGTPSATPEVVIGSVFREILGRIPAQREAPVQTGHPEITRPVQQQRGLFEEGPAPADGSPQRQPTGPFAGQGQGGGSGTGSFAAQPPEGTGSFPAQQPERQTGSFPAQPTEGAPARQTGSFPAQQPERQTGSFPAQQPERQTGSFPAQTGMFQALPQGGGPRQNPAGEGPPQQRPAPGQPERLPQRPGGPVSGSPGSGGPQTGSMPPIPGGPQTGSMPPIPGGPQKAAPGSGGPQTGSMPAIPGSPHNAAPGPGGPQSPAPGSGGPQTGSMPAIPGGPQKGVPGSGGPQTGSMPAVPGSGGPQTGSMPAVPGADGAKGGNAGAGSTPAPVYAAPVPAAPAAPPNPALSSTDHAMVRVVDNLFRSLDKLELAVAVHRLFAEDPVSLRSLAHKMLVDRDALSQAQRTAEERVLHWLRSSESAPVTGHMFRLTEWLGAAATEDQLIGADPAHPVTVPSLRTPLWRVLVTLMPDRRFQDGWLVVGDIHGLQARTRQLLAANPGDGDLVALMSELGIRGHSAKAWLDSLPSEASHDQASEMASSAPALPLPRRTPGANGHHHRGGQPIPSATAGSIDPSAALATLSALSGGRSGMLAGAPSAPPPPLPGPSSEPRRWQRIEVTPEHLRGGPVPVPEGYAAQLGMRPGTLLSVTGPGDNAIVLVWQGHQPVFDSLQPVLMRLNARPGDQVYVTVDGYRLEAQLTG